MLLFNLSIFLLCGSEVSAATTTYYHEYIEQAQYSFKKEYYLLSAQQYDSAFVRWSGTKEHLYEASRSWAYVGNKEKSYQYINKAINKRFYEKDLLINDDRYKKALGNKLFKKIIIKLISEETKFHNGINDSLKSILNHLYYIDQRVRKLVSIYAEKYPDSNHPQIRKLWSRIEFIDSVTTNDLIGIIENYGYPDVSLVGEEANHAARIILNHSNLSVQEKYLPNLKESCQRGESDWDGYAYIFDRIRTKKKQKVMYGCSWYYNETRKTYTFIPEDEHCINYYREQVGLPPLKGYRSYENCSINK